MKSRLERHDNELRGSLSYRNYLKCRREINNFKNVIGDER